MVKYTMKEDPEVIIEVPGKDSPKARDKAMDQLVDLMDAGRLKTNLDNGFGLQDFIEVKPTSLDASPAEDDVIQAVQVLNHLATSKLKMQELRQDALEVRALVDLLFADDLISEEDLAHLKEGFKVLKSFAVANIRYRETRDQATAARETLDRALQPETPPSTSPELSVS